MNEANKMSYTNKVYVNTDKLFKAILTFWNKSTLVIPNSKGLSETLRDIRTSKYQSCGSEETNKSNNHI